MDELRDRLRALVPLVNRLMRTAPPDAMERLLELQDAMEQVLNSVQDEA